MRALILLPLACLLTLPSIAADPVKKQPPQADAAIERNIRDRLAKSKISADAFQVHVVNGVATLEGRTEVVQHKGTATRLAKLGGARSVRNNIQVSDQAKAKAKANLTEGRRRAQVKRGDARSDPRQ